jgi:transposase
MIEPYSLDLRERAVALLDEGASSPEVAEMLGVSDSWVRKMRLRRDRLGHLMPGSPPGKERILTKEDEVVVLDRLNAHRTDRVRELVEARGARLVFLPGYSPDFNPIEHAWSKLKALLRKAGARTLRKLRNALRWALLEISSNDALGYFSHCGFRVPCQ